MFTVIVPVHNEEKNIGEFLEKLIKKAEDIIVVDDGSTDSTYSIAKTFNVRVIRHKKNMGKGQAVITGLKFAKNEEVVLMDGDGQLSPQFIPIFVNKLEKCDFVIGNRFVKKQFIPLHRLIANKLISLLLKNRIGAEDPLCGFKAFKRTFFVDLKEKEFTIDLEMIFTAVDKRLKICEIPISVNYYRGRRSKTTGLLRGITVYSTILLYALKWLSKSR